MKSFYRCKYFLGLYVCTCITGRHISEKSPSGNATSKQSKGCISILDSSIRYLLLSTIHKPKGSHSHLHLELQQKQKPRNSLSCVQCNYDVFNINLDIIAPSFDAYVKPIANKEWWRHSEHLLTHATGVLVTSRSARVHSLQPSVCSAFAVF